VIEMKRRGFITLLGGAATAWPLATRAQQPAMPVVGFLYSVSPDTVADRLRGFHRGLKETGYVEGDNVAIVVRWSDNQINRLPELAAELVRRRVVVIAAGNSLSALAAKAATTTIPIVFAVNEDPVTLGLVASIARPGANVTGINFLQAELTAKRLGFLRQLVPTIARVAVLNNPANVSNTASMLRDVKAAAGVLAIQIQFFNASTNREIDAEFATLVSQRFDAVFVAPDGFFNSRRVQLTALAARHALPVAYPGREFVEVGGLMSYGSNIADAWRQAGVYTGRILKGAKPEDLPVVQASKFELVVNAQTAKLLGLAVPPSLLAAADEVIE
jgi:putative ABC transport system substrate-binding protein